MDDGRRTTMWRQQLQTIKVSYRVLAELFVDGIKEQVMLGYLDFGMLSTVPESVRDGLVCGTNGRCENCRTVGAVAAARSDTVSGSHCSFRKWASLDPLVTFPPGVAPTPTQELKLKVFICQPWPRLFVVSVESGVLLSCFVIWAP